MNRSFFLESLGCAKNQVDSEHIISLLEHHRLVYTVDPAHADCLIVNTCGFIQSAKEESIAAVLDFRQRFPDKKIILVGCLARRYRKELEGELGEVNGIWGDIRHPSFPTFVLKVMHPAGGRKRPAETQSVSAATDYGERRRLLSFPGSVYIKISEGCGNNCTYCAIPLIRGKLVSRERREIIREARAFLDRGLREINLIAQDTAAFGTDRGGPELVRLLTDLAALPGDYWIRLLYLHPDHFPDMLLDLIAASSRLLPYFDIPFQHGSGRILTAMNRRGDADSYTALVDRIRARLPQAVLRTTFLVGFPGESEDDFQQLLDFQERIAPQWAGVFVYSPEEGTRAAVIKPRVPKKTARERQQILETRQTAITHRWLDGLAGRLTGVLLEERVEGEDLFLGRAWFQAPEVDGLVVASGAAGQPGEMVRVRIAGRAGMDLKGEMTGE
jgi:ribosomal protein S12 methylthiotransferase